MSKFNNKKSGDMPPVSTASLPDIVFMLLFFFMTVTVMKSDDLRIENVLPNASEVKKLEKKDRIVYIHIGQPRKEYQEVFGTASRIQVNDKFIAVAEVGSYVLSAIGEKPEALQRLVTIALKVDKNANMGLIDDVKEELRKVNALKINYTTYEGDVFANLK